MDSLAGTPWFVWFSFGAMALFGIVLGLAALFTASK
jgi:uncharacterized membrane protein